MDGAIFLHRSLLDSYAFSNETTLKIWIWLLLRANWKKGYIDIDIGKGKRTIEINRGQMLFGRIKAAEKLGIPASTIERHLEKLIEKNQIGIKKTPHYSIISIKNYNDYQQDTQGSEQPMNSQRTANEQPMNTYNNNNNNNNNIDSGGKPPALEKKKNIEERKKEFIDSLKEYLDIYGRDMLNDFYKYWTEKNKSGTKMKFELQKTWETNLRLATWSKRENEFAPKNKKKDQSEKEKELMKSLGM